MTLSNEPFYLKGDRPEAILFLHGLGGGVYELRPLADHLHQTGFTVYGFNYPGHENPKPLMPASNWKQWYSKAKEAYIRLRQDFERIHLIGFSTGVPLAVYLAHENPIGKLIALSPFYQIKYKWYYVLPVEFYVQTIGRLIEHVPRRKLPIRDQIKLVEAEQVSHFHTFNLSAVRSALELIELSRLKLPLIHAPTLVLQSRRDQVVDPKGAEFFFRHLSSCEKKLIWFEDSDHVLTLDHERDQVYQRVLEFLSKVN
ncbi:MAG: alpha/beta fold hydrolase [Candidatus Caenarcaniphilales bacterium]|nr:alpha/beta fold hydrolase [Candidatus Caenarcaniphilales bacterium]